MEALEIIHALGIAVITAIATYYFNKTNKNQEEFRSEIVKLKVNEASRDSGYEALREKNLEAETNLKKDMSGLAKDMRKTSEMVNKILAKQDLHELEIQNIKVENSFIASQLRKIKN